MRGGTTGLSRSLAEIGRQFLQAIYGRCWSTVLPMVFPTEGRPRLGFSHDPLSLSLVDFVMLVRMLLCRSSDIPGDPRELPEDPRMPRLLREPFGYPAVPPVTPESGWSRDSFSKELGLLGSLDRCLEASLGAPWGCQGIPGGSWGVFMDFPRGTLDGPGMSSAVLGGAWVVLMVLLGGLTGTPNTNSLFIYT